MTYRRSGHPDGPHDETVRDVPGGKVIGRVKVRTCMTPAEMAWYRTMVKTAARLAGATYGAPPEQADTP
jgi:hypothetical protein